MAQARRWSASAGQHSLLALPPYSPELNPVENVWQFLRQNSQQPVFPTYEAIVGACCESWNKLVGMPDRIRSIR
jgi:transposase